MPSLPKLSSAGMAFLLSLLHLLLSGSAQGASLREHRLRGSELDPQRGDTPYLPPNADMLKALEYIESLRQQTGALAPQEQASLTLDYDTTNMDTDSEKLLSMLRLPSPAQTSQSNIGQGQDQDEDDEEGEGNKENKTQEWLQAVLNTLQQTKKGPKPAPVRPSAARHALGKGRRPAKEEDSQVGEGVAYPWTQHASRPHRKYPLMFEDEENGEEEGRVQGRESPFKRTNENMEGKYTPQNLANLQSVFEELGRIANAKAGHKRQTEDDGDDDMFKVRNLAYEDVTGGEDWSPLEEQVDKEDEEIDNRQEFDRGFEDDEDDDDDDDNEDDEEIDEVKRSSQLGPREYDPDDYYLLKVLEKTEQQKRELEEEEEQKRELEEEEEQKRELEEEEEQKRELEEEEEQKRELEEEEEREERRAAQTQYSDKVDPQAIYQLIQISQKLQIPPEDLMDMLKSGEMTKQDRTPLRTKAQSWTPNDLARVEDKLTQISSHQKTKIPAETFFNRLPETQTSNIPEEINTEDILKILGLGSVANQNVPALKKQKQHTSPPSRFYAPAGKQKNYMFSEPNIPEKGTDDYDNTVNEDELSTYLAAQMLAQYPQTANQKKRTSQSPSQDHQLVLGTFEQAIQDYFDQMDSDKSPPQKRQSDPKEDTGHMSQKQGLDDDTLLKILNYLNPETEEGEDTDFYAQTVKGL
uniref:secretogranin-2-like n=1 Tax=Oncorhynchus gorbuscha TaxID=8017 RepID=UPI001EAEE46C|nr:secretogranin-2-like [Oncorhynchus gorbuscha]